MHSTNKANVTKKKKIKKNTKNTKNTKHTKKMENKRQAIRCSIKKLFKKIWFVR